ncbi:polysaccharide biosynthesis tyrosine autokinase Ptk1 [Porphyromonas gingivalis]|uniref:polysaccharide biosynthesis tyrosine autokinase Ptk1 n=1 Tax=Porphyromonas gingivalis TaxID=837 RepID=UPI0026594040|nr:polysaccharide biosynthesis tyrosine autokinase Ptk1 [Porphyromonas gingivalis]MDP0532097.1 polysaccharide biosynthesis tyrosine autokinase Ptk1 [Porphyromonas gingivalis]MDP0624582.1 polysaccharide biosynthesis tyrosine autokinase Ptk1 [Porphyromonas gingivalis]WKD52169.1 polysaccharide biosynthesis tyrosine autokinase Ptk1 [Porphyromonas gingivalis]WKD54220.1 polysaccharide biosynthesis tyrosine autokinase Ptk1 [Porphyromonas gingivalis]
MNLIEDSKNTLAESRSRIYTKEETSFFSIEEYLLGLLSSWKWIVGSIIVCLLVAYIYTQRQSPAYIAQAAVLIKSAEKSGAPRSMKQFEEIGLFMDNSEVENEILVLKSKRLTAIVVDKLDLDVSISKDGFWRHESLYGKSPVSIRITDRDSTESYSFKIDIKDSRSFQLSDFKQQKLNRISEIKVEGSFGRPIATPVGELQIDKTIFFADSWKGGILYVTKENIRKVIQRYNKDLQISLADKNATIVNLSMKNEDMDCAKDFLNVLISSYNDDVMNDKKSVAVSTAAFIDERLAMIGGELGTVDTEIETFKKSNNITDISTDVGAFLKSNADLQKDQLVVERNLSLAKYIQSFLRQTSTDNELMPANLGLTERGIDNSITLYNDLKLKYDRLKQSSSESNPLVQEMAMQLVAMRKSINAAVDNYIKTLNLQLREVNREMSRTKEQISAVPTQEKIMSTILRQQKIKEELYLYLLNKREENALRLAITESNAKIVDAADGPSAPIAPRKPLIFMAASLLGLVLPSTFIYVKMQFDKSVRGRKDLEGLLIPFLGEIPTYSGERSEEDLDVVVKPESRDSASEAFRILRSNMEFMRVKSQDLKAVMFTSANTGSGKSFMTVNLAISIALTGKKVIVVDLDIRKGSLSKRLGLGNIGVTDFLYNNSISVDSLITKFPQNENLDLVLAGCIPPNPAELLLSDRLDYLIKELKNRYDYVFLDSVPAMSVADAMITNRVADLTIYVIRQGVLDRRYLGEIERLYTENKFTNMCLVLNDVSYSGSRGTYGYGYGYGYGNKEYDKQGKKLRRRSAKKTKKFKMGPMKKS